MAPKNTKIKEMELKMEEKMLTDLKDMQFNMTEKMKEQIRRLLVIKQTLDNEDLTLTYKEQKLLQKEFNTLLSEFRTEFQANNKMQVQFMRSYLGIK